jgi:hypothetical protein
MHGKARAAFEFSFSAIAKQSLTSSLSFKSLHHPKWSLHTMLREKTNRQRLQELKLTHHTISAAPLAVSA